MRTIGEVIGAALAVGFWTAVACVGVYGVCLVAAETRDAWKHRNDEDPKPLFLSFDHAGHVVTGIVSGTAGIYDQEFAPDEMWFEDYQAETQEMLRTLEHIRNLPEQ